MLRFLDGWKRQIVVLLYAIGAIYGMTTGQNATPLVDAAVKAAGEQPADAGDMALAMNLATLAVTAWAVGSTFAKAYRQRKAGATVKETLSTEGYVKEAIASGVIPAETPITPQKDAVSVAVVEKVEKLQAAEQAADEAKG